MLGGEVGKLSNPFELLRMAQTDISGIQDSIVQMAASTATFNEETGEFDISVGNLYKLREAASKVGMSYQEMTELALNAAKKTKKLEFIDKFTNVSEDQKELIANLSQFEGGELKIKLAGEKDLLNIQELTSTQIEGLQSYQEKLGQTDKELAVEAAERAIKANGYLSQMENSLTAVQLSSLKQLINSRQLISVIRDFT